MPGIQEEDACNEIQNPSTRHGDDECVEELVLEEKRDGEVAVGGCERLLYTFHRNEYRGKEEISHNDGPKVHLSHVVAIVSLWSIAEREHKARHKDSEVGPLADDGENHACLAKKVCIAECDC